MMSFTRLEACFKQSESSYRFVALESIDSTSAYLKRVAKTSLEPTFCITRVQTNGYGQRERQWLSNEDSLTFSLLCRFPVPLHQLDSLSQRIGLLLIETLSQFFDDAIYIKWPNDLYSSDGKIAGLLIESVKFDENSCWLVVGIGLNLALIDSSCLCKQDKTNFNFLKNPISYLQKPSTEEGGEKFLQAFLLKFEALTKCFSVDSFKNYLEEYQKNDYFDLGQEVIVYDTEQSISGRYKGLTQRGELLLESEGNMITYRSGNVSIRAINDI